MSVSLDLAVGHDQYDIRVLYRRQSVRNRQHSAVSKLVSDALLYQAVGLDVDVSSCLVEHQNLVLSQNRACQSNQLFLAD